MLECVKGCVVNFQLGYTWRNHCVGLGGSRQHTVLMLCRISAVLLLCGLSAVLHYQSHCCYACYRPHRVISRIVVMQVNSRIVLSAVLLLCRLSAILRYRPCCSLLSVVLLINITLLYTFLVFVVNHPSSFQGLFCFGCFRPTVVFCFLLCFFLLPLPACRSSSRRA